VWTKSVSYSLELFQAIFIADRELFDSLDVPGCYLLTNTRNGKAYVGQSEEVATRIRKHTMRSGYHDVTTDLRAGHPFHVDIFLFDPDIWEDLDDMERYYISLFDTYNRGYNKTGGNK